MREISTDELRIILDNHAKYLAGDGGERANLTRANLTRADLTGADLAWGKGQHYITQRTDGYQFFLVQDESKKWFIRAGCQYMTIEDYREHVKEYSDESKRIETGLILDFAEAKLKAVVA